jgi:hypothetical protein
LLRELSILLKRRFCDLKLDSFAATILLDLVANQSDGFGLAFSDIDCRLLFAF